jgi:hypothetical protein
LAANLYYENMKKESKNWLKLPEPFRSKPSSVAVINNSIDRYIYVADGGIALAQVAFDLPLETNFNAARRLYIALLERGREFLIKIGQKEVADEFFGATDGVYTPLDICHERLGKNAIHNYTVYTNPGDGRVYVDGIGIEMLGNMQRSLRDKMVMLRNLKSEIATREQLKKMSTMNRKANNASGTDTRYITKKGDDFYYHGCLVEISKNNDYYRVFCALYALIPNGGKIRYKKIIAEVRIRVSKLKNQSDAYVTKFIQRNITDKGNGFMRYANIPGTEDNGKPLIKTIRGYGIEFNNTSE